MHRTHWDYACYCREALHAESLLAQFPLAGQDTAATECMIQGSGHAEDASYQTVYVDLDSGFCCFADSKKPKPVEAADIEAGMHVADIEQR